MMHFTMPLLESTRSQKKMNIAFCNFTKKWGGVKTWTIEFAKALQQRGHGIFIYGRKGAFIERARQNGLQAQAVSFGFDFNPYCIATFYRDFVNNNVDVLVVNVGHDLRTAGIAATLAGLSVVHRIGLPGDLDNTPQVRLQHKILHPHYLCPCYYIRDGLLERLPFIQEQDVTVIHTAKNVVTEQQSVHAPLQIISTSQLTVNKGHAELACTLALLKQEGFSFVWNIVGEGAARESIETLCATLGLEEHVIFHGFSQNVGSFLLENDVFVLSSYVEGFPNTLLEAMAHGLVPVARCVGGVGECWPVDLPELLVPYTPYENKEWERIDWVAKKSAELPLYAPLRRLLGMPAEGVLALKKASLAHCHKNFSLNQQAIKLESFFASIMQK